MVELRVQGRRVRRRRDTLSSRSRTTFWRQNASSSAQDLHSAPTEFAKSMDIVDSFVFTSPTAKRLMIVTCNIEVKSRCTQLGPAPFTHFGRFVVVWCATRSTAKMQFTEHWIVWADKSLWVSFLDNISHRPSGTKSWPTRHSLKGWMSEKCCFCTASSRILCQAVSRQLGDSALAFWPGNCHWERMRKRSVWDHYVMTSMFNESSSFPSFSFQNNSNATLCKMNGEAGHPNFEHTKVSAAQQFVLS